MIFKGWKIGLLIIAFATIAWFRTLPIGQALDHWVYEQAIILSQNKAWLWGWMGVTAIGYGQFVVPLLSAIILWGVARKRNWQWFCVMAIAWLAFEANPYLKNLFHTDRPVTLLDEAHLASFSFPSGHAFNAVFLFYLLPRLWVLQKTSVLKHSRVLSWMFWLPGVVLISASRLFLGAHWVNDVLGGAVHGFIWAQIILWVLEMQTNKDGIHDAQN